jgi:hypothetical protein
VSCRARCQAFRVSAHLLAGDVGQSSFQAPQGFYGGLAGGEPAPVAGPALYGWAFHKERRTTQEPDEDTAAAITWVRANSLKVVTLDEKDRRSELIRRALDAIALTMDGKPAAATVVARKRSVFYGVLGYAVELDILPANPIDKVAWKAPETADQVDRRVVASPRQVDHLLAAVANERPELVAFFACLYYAFLRPAEAAALTIDSCELPAKGWGRLILTGSAKRVGAAWTDHGRSATAGAVGLLPRARLGVTADRGSGDVPGTSALP